MSKKSNEYGRSFEFAVIDKFYKELSKIRKTKILKNSEYITSKKYWKSIDFLTQLNLKKSAETTYKALIELEPLIIEKSNDYLELFLQVDKNGEMGDCRDLIIKRNDIYLEVGLSLKHNNFAVKHSRLSRKIDFGNKWFGNPCSSEYWNAVFCIFEYLQRLKNNKVWWNFLKNKSTDVYLPLLKAFRREMLNSVSLNQDFPKKMVEYLLGKYDFYKVISIDANEIVNIQAFNLRGQLNKYSLLKKTNSIIPIAPLPTRIINFDFRPKSNTTLDLYMDEGWKFSFRIHNASKLVEPSLKFDVQLIGMPAEILTMTYSWNK